MMMTVTEATMMMLTNKDDNGDRNNDDDGDRNDDDDDGEGIDDNGNDCLQAQG